MLVLGELLRRGIVAGLTPRNMRRYDIIAAQDGRAVSIRVKTKSNAATWLWSVRKDGTIFGEVTINDFTVLVDLQQSDAAVNYYVAPTQQLEDEIKKGFKVWAETPGKNGKPRNPANWERRFGTDEGQPELLDMWINNWQAITAVLEGAQP